MKSSIEVWRGSSTPLGSAVKKGGVNFAVYSERAEKVEICLFDAEERETARVAITEHTNHVWHCFVPGLAAGQLYGLRVYGPYDPAQGLRFNPNKLLIDPYAKATSGPIQWDHSVFGYTVGNDNEDLSFDERDSAAFMPKSITVSDRFDWGDDAPPQTPWNETIIYEMHVKGFTKMLPEVPEKIRGTYEGLAHPAAIDYLKKLGVTAVELLPIQKFADDEYLAAKGLRNYWGYSSIGFFAPDWKYSSSPKLGSQVGEFKKMVKALHDAGIEVILDVVYNHTAEGNHMGPTLSFKGIDNAAYYRLVQDDPRFYMDYTGTGNSLNVVNHNTLRLIMDSLRYWVSEMHVDGFRFDLASTLARGFHEVNQLNAFFGIIQQDPILSEVKLIAEPWDLGEGGYQVGQFPNQWTEWNDKYRDTVRGFWKGEEGKIGDLGFRLMGSSDLYEHTGRRPFASINFITAHDGFTLNDLVSYNEKHNEANLEDNRDGNDNNHSWNCGAEGPTDDPAINGLRSQMKRNFLATLFLSQGVPMLVAGDEWGRSQGGNNNAYCQDNEISWLNWDHADRKLLNFSRQLIELRKSHRIFNRRGFFQGESLRKGSSAIQDKDLAWFNPDGGEMSDEEWSQDFAKVLGIFMNGKSLRELNSHNQPVADDSFIWLLNASHVPIEFTFPKDLPQAKWTRVFDTSDEASCGAGESAKMDLTKTYTVQPRATVLLQQARG